jgi:hypothetical protein
MDSSSSSSIRKVSLGNGRAYLWKSTRSNYAHRLVITAHGAAVNDSRSRAMESGSHAPLLHFYSLHGNDVDDEGLRSYAQGVELAPSSGSGQTGPMITSLVSILIPVQQAADTIRPAKPIPI